ncbi:hypothetical protein ADEAN_000291900 [Angomonas deanei]|uniref:Uncharacterized protein n=1 Tax=Angomonas deanei TaxID=59799 RepID=A0A7G2C8M8_9TRYP|nr:hypothetical protein ADEAN_000291900 [Angomonas deanei]
MSDSSVLDLEKKWYTVTLPVKTCSLKDIANSNTTKEDMDRYFQEAQEVLERECSVSSMDRGRWYSSQFLSRGTTSDRIASAAVKLSDTDFMFFLEGFNLLFDTARADTHHYEAALKALSAVWPRLLPARPLKRFISQYFATLPEDEASRNKVLVYWYLEDYLKSTYTQFLSLCESMLKDRIVQRREAWLDLVGKLLCSVAEGRNTAMAMIIDKLGDPNSQIAHKAYHHLLTLLSESSTHQQSLFTELEKIIFMKNCPLRTMRYAANVMNQLVYSKDERKLAIKAVQTYLFSVPSAGDHLPGGLHGDDGDHYRVTSRFSIFWYRYRTSQRTLECAVCAGEYRHLPTTGFYPFLAPAACPRQGNPGDV